VPTRPVDVDEWQSNEFIVAAAVDRGPGTARQGAVPPAAIPR